MRPRLAPCALAVMLLAAPSAFAVEEPFDERGENVFFRRPDRETSQQIAEEISRFSVGSVRGRMRSRRALVEIGYWSVAPLIAALEDAEPPIKSASALTLTAIRDPRAVDPLRRAVQRETSHPYVAGFAAVGLGRYRDLEAVEPFRRALRSSKGMAILRAAVPFALARIGTPEARTVLMERMRAGEGNVHVRSARFLAMGFFEGVAVAPDRPVPSESLMVGVKSNRREERRAALLGFLVATRLRTDTRPFLLRLLEKEDAPEVLRPALLGLACYEDSDTTAYLARRAARPGDDDVRIAAVDLLLTRGDPAALPDLMSILRRPASARIKAAAVLALASIDDADAATAVVDRLNDKDRLVRAAAAVAATRLGDEDARVDAAARIDGRLRRHGESNRTVRHNLQIARRLLTSETQTAPRWREIGEALLFAEIDLTHEQRLLREVNLAVEDALDLTKIHNLQTDTEVLGGGDVDGAGDGEGDDGGDDGGGDGDGDGEPGEPGGPGGDSGAPGDTPTTGSGPAVGANRTSAWQELRDLKVELRREPFFGPEDL